MVNCLFPIMPHLPFASNNAPEDDVQEIGLQVPEQEPRKRKNSVLGRIQKIGQLLRGDETRDETPLSNVSEAEGLGQEHSHREETFDQQEGPEQRPEEKPTRRPSLLGRRGYRRAVPELPRSLTFRRQNSEKRERLLAVEPTITERRAVSADRRPQDIGRRSRGSPPLTPLPSLSAPEVGTPVRHSSFTALQLPPAELDLEGSDWPEPIPHEPPSLSPLEDPPVLEDDNDSDVLDERELQAELESKWILNLSMHFRDKSDREKFFVTYAQEPNRWRRVTVSLDYRDADADTLEADLKSLHYQRDKSARIYEAVRDSLADIQFFDTVTNLKLKTDEGRLHVHVTEDVNEVISYPSTDLVEHINCNRYRESELEFDAHLSGFVYRIRVDDRIFIKKEIPGPDTVDEFLYEVNALDALQDSKSVIRFHGLVIDEECLLVKGLLISFAPRGPLVDMLYDYKDTDQLPWERREQWAFQIIEGLSEIHEAGFVQGDFTLSNIVIDSEDDAKIIDINRRGCPVGWEPPELLSLIHSGQRISMCIGVKSDLFQLGMVLWALAEKIDEPENVERLGDRLPPVADEETPLWFKRIVEVCLSERPRDRLSAKELLYHFPPPPAPEPEGGDLRLSDHSIRSRRSDKQYIDPAAAVHLEDIEEHRRERFAAPPSHLTSEPYTFADLAPSTNYKFRSEGSYIITDRGAENVIHAQKPSSSRTSVTSRGEHDTTRGRETRQHMCPMSVSSEGTEPGNQSTDSTEGYRDRGKRIGSPSEQITRFAPDLDSSLDAGPGAEDDDTSNQVRRHEGAYFSHQDSGFDEEMIAGIESSAHLADTQSYSPELDDDSHLKPEDTTLTAPRLGLSEQTEDWPSSRGDHSAPQPHPQSLPEPLIPFSYHTPLTTPLPGIAAHSGHYTSAIESTTEDVALAENNSSAIHVPHDTS